MFLTINTENTGNYNNYKKRNFQNHKYKKPYISQNTKKGIKGLACLAVLGASVVSYTIYKKNVNTSRLHEIKYIGQSIANHAVQTSESRSSDAVKIYSKHIADRKAASLKYRMDNGMFIGKSREAMNHIKNNLKQLELDAI